MPACVLILRESPKALRITSFMSVLHSEVVRCSYTSSSVRRSGGQVALYLSTIVPLLRTEREGFVLQCYKHRTPSPDYS